MIDRGAEDLALVFEDGETGRQVERRGIGAVAIDDEDALKAVVGQAATHVLDVADKGVPRNGQGAVEIHVVRAVAVGDRRGEHGFFRDASHGALANAVAQHHVRIHRQMRAVVFVGGDGQHGHAARGCSVPGLVPNHFSVAVFHSGSLLECSRVSARERGKKYAIRAAGASCRSSTVFGIPSILVEGATLLAT